MARPERAATETPVEKETGRPKLPLPPSKTRSIEQLLEYWQGIAPEFRPRLIGYLYRHWPIIVRDPSYIDKISEPPASQEEILRRWGTGSYELKVNDMDKPRGGEVCRARFKFAESITEYEPVLEVLELDQGHKDNKTFVEWLRSKGKLKMPGDNPTGDASAAVLAKALVDLATNRNQQPAVAPLDNTALKSALDIMGDATKQAISTVKSQQDPSGVSGMLKELKEFVKPAPTADPLELLKTAKDIIAPAGNNSTDKLIEILLKTQADSQKAIADAQSKHMELLMKMIEQKQESGDLASQVEKIGGIVAAVRELGGGEGGGRSGKWWQELLMTAAAPGGPFAGIITPLTTWVLAKASGWKPGQPAPGAPPPQQPGAPPTLPPAGLPGTPPPNPAAPAADPQEQFMLDQLINTLSPLIQPLLKYLEEGKSGDEFCCDMYDVKVLTMPQINLIRSIGKDKIVALLKQSPIGAMVVQNEAQITQFLDEFLACDPSQPQEQE